MHSAIVWFLILNRNSQACSPIIEQLKPPHHNLKEKI